MQVIKKKRAALGPEEHFELCRVNEGDPCGLEGLMDGAELLTMLSTVFTVSPTTCASTALCCN